MGARTLYASGASWLFDQLRAAFGQSGATATIEARTPTRGGYTDTTPTWGTVVASDVPCLVKPLRVEQVVRQGRDVAKLWSRVYFTADPGVTREHRLTIAGASYIPAGTVELDGGGSLYRVDCYKVAP